MATLYERMLRQGNYDQEGDGSAIDTHHLRVMLRLYESDDVTAAQVKTVMNLTPGQESDMDDLLATRPVLNALTSILNGADRFRWVDRICDLLEAGLMGLAPFNDPDDLAAAFGV